MEVISDYAVSTILGEDGPRVSAKGHTKVTPMTARRERELGRAAGGSKSMAEETRCGAWHRRQAVGK